MGHNHGGAGVAHRSRLAVVLALTVTVLVVEAVTAWFTGSLALLADAGHMLSDAFGLAMALGAITVAQRGGGPGSRRSFGNHRTEILAAAANALLLLGLALWIAASAVGRLAEAPQIDGTLMIAAGVLGLGANGVGLYLLRPGAGQSLNVKGAYLEVLGDAFGSVAVIVAAGIIMVTGWNAADAVASLVIAALIVPRAISLLWDVVEVLLESTPRGIDLGELRTHIVGIDGVQDVHDLHVWTITSGMPVMSAHVVVDESVCEFGHSGIILDRLRGCLSEHFDVEHSTFQIEPEGHANKEDHIHH